MAHTEDTSPRVPLDHITIQRAEGRSTADFTPHRFTTWTGARLHCLDIARTVDSHVIDGNECNADKVDFSIHWKDGQEWGGTLCIKPNGEDADIARHVRQFLDTYSGRVVPLHVVLKGAAAVADFRAHLSRYYSDSDRADCARILDRYSFRDEDPATTDTPPRSKVYTKDGGDWAEFLSAMSSGNLVEIDAPMFEYWRDELPPVQWGGTLPMRDGSTQPVQFGFAEGAELVTGFWTECATDAPPRYFCRQSTKVNA